MSKPASSAECSQCGRTDRLNAVTDRLLCACVFVYFQIELSLGELQSTGVAAAVVALRKHADSGISTAAKSLRDHWKEVWVM